MIAILLHNIHNPMIYLTIFFFPSFSVSYFFFSFPLDLFFIVIFPIVIVLLDHHIKVPARWETLKGSYMKFGRNTQKLGSIIEPLEPELYIRTQFVLYLEYTHQNPHSINTSMSGAFCSLHQC